MIIAVYGTLKKGNWNHHYLGNSRFVCNSNTGEGYALFIDQLPFLIKRDDGIGCEIEIYEVDEPTLKELDLLEGHPLFYTRTLLRNSEEGPVYIYLYNDSDGKLKSKKINLSFNSF